MKKINKLVAIAFVAIGLAGIQGCEKIFTTGELKGTWTVTSNDSNGKSETKYVDDTSIDGELLTRTNTWNNTATVSESETIETFDGTGSPMALVTRTTKSKTDANSDFRTITSKFKNDSTYIDTTMNIDLSGFTKTNTMKFTFENDGTFTAVSSSSNKGTGTTELTGRNIVHKIDHTSTSEITGTWAYLGENKSDELKTNQRIGLWYTSSKNTSKDIDKNSTIDTDNSDMIDWSANEVTFNSETKSTSTYTQTPPQVVWQLISKANGEMVVETQNSTNKYNSKTIYSDTNNPGIEVISTSENSSSSTGKMSLTKEK